MSKAGIPPLKALYFYLTSYCNLNCAHCWIAPRYTGMKRAPQEAAFKSLKSIIDQALPLGLKAIKITGGEPFLSRNISRLISYASKKVLAISIETNATLIDETIARSLKRNNVQLVYASLDGPDKRTHGRLRKDMDSFDRALSGIRLLKKYGIYTQVIMSIYRDNAASLEDTINVAEKYGADSFKINTIWPVSRGKLLDEKGLALSVKEYIALNKKIEQVIQPRHRIKIFFDIPPAFKKIKHLKENSNICGIKNILGVLPDARISICGIGQVTSNLAFGDTKREKLKDIWEDSLVLNSIRRRVPGRLKGVCGICVFKGFCLGKCRAEAYHKNKDLFSPHYFCEEAYNTGLFPENRLMKKYRRRKR